MTKFKKIYITYKYIQHIPLRYYQFVFIDLIAVWLIENSSYKNLRPTTCTILNVYKYKYYV